jgi:hypothetical protein
METTMTQHTRSARSLLPEGDTTPARPITRRAGTVLHLFRLLGAAAAGGLVAFGGMALLKGESPASQPAPFLFTQAETEAVREPARTVRVRLPESVRRPSVVSREPLRAAMIVDGEAHDAEDGPLVLEDGRRFHVSMRAGRQGVLEVHAIAPDGYRAGVPLWATPVDAGQRVATPTLRLEGLRGLETLGVVLRGQEGEVIAQRVFHIAHD